MTASYRDSTLLSIFAVPSNAIFLDDFQTHFHTNLLHVLLKIHWYSSKGPNNNRHYNDFSHMQDFCNFIFQ